MVNNTMAFSQMVPIHSLYKLSETEPKGDNGDAKQIIFQADGKCFGIYFKFVSDLIESTRARILLPPQYIMVMFLSVGLVTEAP